MSFWFLIPFWWILPHLQEPQKADLPPPGHQMIMCVQVGNESHVIFRKDHHWAVYVNGKFDSEGNDL